MGLLQPVNYDRWKRRSHVTPLEFAFLLAGFDPVPNQFLITVIEELQKIIYSINRHVPFRDISYSDNKVLEFMKILRDAYPQIKNEEEMKNKILEQSQLLLDCLEIINRAMFDIAPKHVSCFSKVQGRFKERLWRFDFLICWVKRECNISIPMELADLDRNFSFPEDKNLPDLLTEKSIFTHSWFNTDKCDAVKLKAIIEAYSHIYTKNQSRDARDVSSGEIKEYILKNYDVLDKNGDIVSVDSAESFVKRLSEVATHKQTGSTLKKKDNHRKS